MTQVPKRLRTGALEVPITTFTRLESPHEGGSAQIHLRALRMMRVAAAIVMIKATTIQKTIGLSLA